MFPAHLYAEQAQEQPRERRAADRSRPVRLPDSLAGDGYATAAEQDGDTGPPLTRCPTTISARPVTAGMAPAGDGAPAAKNKRVSRCHMTAASVMLFDTPKGE